MNVLMEVLESTQPGYEAAVGKALLLMMDTFGEDAFSGWRREEFAARATNLLAAGRLVPGLRLQLISDISSLGWWCDIGLTDEVTAALGRIARATYSDQARGLAPPAPPQDRHARTSHAVFVGQLVGPLHSPTRGAFEYVRALAQDPENRRVEIFHSGPLAPELRAFAEERLEGSAAEIAMTEWGERLLAELPGLGGRTCHFWCEQPYAPHISLAARGGPTIMFTCGDTAPVQYSDVFWYCHEAAYVDRLWARKGAPAIFSAHYAGLESAPFHRSQALRRRSRKDLGFGDDETIVVTVGNRVAVEIDQPFVDGIGALLADDPKRRWVIVGDLPDYWIAAFTQVLGKQFDNVPFDDDLMSLFACCDVFANPFRAGGGNTAVMAIDAGAVVMTRGDLGDVAAFVPSTHRAQDSESYFQNLDRLVSEPAMRGAWLAEQQALLGVRLDQDRFAAELKALITLASDRYHARAHTPLDALYSER